MMIIYRPLRDHRVLAVAKADYDYQRVTNIDFFFPFSSLALTTAKAG